MVSSGCLGMVSFFFTLRIEESETQLKFVKEKGSIYGKNKIRVSDSG